MSSQKSIQRFLDLTHAGFCVEALRKAITAYERLEIVNTDQDSQFTGGAWIETLTEAGVSISLDGRERCMDNTKIDRLRRSLKNEAA